MPTPKIHNVPLPEIDEAFRAPLDSVLENTGLVVAELAAMEDTRGQKPNSARTSAGVYLDALNGPKLGDLYVIAFAPRDSTGDNQNGFKLDHVTFAGSGYPRRNANLPRYKKKSDRNESIITEVAITLGSHETTADRHTPYLGNAALVGVGDVDRSGKYPLVTIGELGQPRSMIEGLVGSDDLEPAVQYTTGDVNHLGRNVNFGDPHFVYQGDTGRVVVFAFLGVTEANRENADRLTALDPQLPLDTPVPSSPAFDV